MEARNDVRDKLLSLNEKFSSVVDQFAEWSQGLLNGDEHSIRKAIDSIMNDSELQRFLYDPHFETGHKFCELFSRAGLRDHLDIFNTMLLKGLLKIPRNTIGELSFSSYEFHKEEFIRNTRVMDYASVVDNVVKMKTPHGFAVVEMKFARSTEVWPNKTLKEVHSFLEYVYKEYAWLPTETQVTEGVLVLRWNTPNHTREQVRRRTERQAHFLLEKGCVVSIAKEPVGRVSVSSCVRLYGSMCIYICYESPYNLN